MKQPLSHEPHQVHQRKSRVMRGIQQGRKEFMAAAQHHGRVRIPKHPMTHAGAVLAGTRRCCEVVSWLFHDRPPIGDHENSHRAQPRSGTARAPRDRLGRLRAVQRRQANPVPVFLFIPGPWQAEGGAEG